MKIKQYLKEAKTKIFNITAYNTDTMSVDSVGFDYTKPKAEKRMKKLMKDREFGFYKDFKIKVDYVEGNLK